MIFMALILVVNILALDTTIIVKTKPSYAVNVRVLDTDGSGTLEGGAFLDQIANENGEVTVTYSSETVNKIDISLMIKNSIGGGIIQFEGGPVQKIDNNGEHIKTGWPVEIDTTINPPLLVKSGRTEEVVEEIAVVEENVTIETEVVEEEETDTTNEIDQESSPGITGRAVEGVKDVAKSKKTYYILGGLIVLIAAGLFLKKKMNKKGNIKVTKLSEIKNNKEKIEHTDDELDDAERKIKEAKEELDAIRDKKKNLREAKERLETDKIELKRLESEENT